MRGQRVRWTTHIDIEVTKDENPIIFGTRVTGSENVMNKTIWLKRSVYFYTKKRAKDRKEYN